MQRIANPSTPVRFRPQPQFLMNRITIISLIIATGVSDLSFARKFSYSYGGINPTLYVVGGFLIDHEQSVKALDVSILGYVSPSLTSSLTLSNQVYKEINESFLAI